MKILMTSTGAWGTGSFMVIKAMLKEFEDLGHEVHVLFPDKPANKDKDQSEYYDDPRFHLWEFPISDGDVRIENFPLMIGDPNPRNPEAIVLKDLSQAQFDLYFESFRKRAQEVIGDFQPDIVEAHHIWMMNNVISKLGLPVVPCAHNSDQMGFRQDKRMQGPAKEGADLAQLIFCVSDQVRDDVIQLYGQDPAKVVTVTNGYDDEVYVPKKVDRKDVLDQLEISIPDGTPIVTFVGKLSKTKGVDVLFEANEKMDSRRSLAQTPVRAGKGWSGDLPHIIMFGAGDLDKVIDRNDSKYNLDRVHFVGHHPSEIISDTLNVSKLAVFPSRSEGFPLAPLEAMGCGVPIVITRCGSPESFAVGELVDIEDAQGLASGIQKILEMDESSYENLSKQALEKAREYSWKLIAKQRHRLYGDVIRKFGS